MMQVLSSGALNLIQDRGRLGHMHLGVSASGAMDSCALDYANALVGNDADAAVIEITVFPYKLRFDQDTVFACTGADARIELDNRAIAPWWSHAAKAGQHLVIGRPRRGMRVYLSIAGGIDCAVVLGSRSTDLKSGFGGQAGRGLKRLDTLTAGTARTILPDDESTLPAGLGCIPARVPEMLRQIESGCLTVRVLPAAEHDEFDETSRARFYAEPWLLTPDANRQGYRLQGQHALQMTQRRELLSHGIVPGTVQVPPAGQPIIQLAEANTCGGYPKMATVIEADRWQLGQLPTGCALRFLLTDLPTAVAAMRQQASELDALRRNLRLMAGRVPLRRKMS